MQVMEDGIEVGCRGFMHDDGDGQMPVEETVGAENFETAHMGTQQNATSLLFEVVPNDRLSFHSYVEVPLAS
jgi:hypothetical protein